MPTAYPHAVVLYGMSGRDNYIYSIDPQFGRRTAPLAEFRKIRCRYLVGYKTVDPGSAPVRRTILSNSRTGSWFRHNAVGKSPA